ncbi:hypothetical protein KM043_011937 [Ampulex compressa]|nr:hypothetical protein KM043_011937 [Ampulex compressa]
MAVVAPTVISGFKEDCERLISRFEQADGIRFESFCEIWKDMKFSLIFVGHQTILELLEFCEEALYISKRFLLWPTRFKERVGGLYLLYGIYYKMPTEKYKIRIRLEDWKNIMDFHAQIIEAEHLDANYILSKLIADNAFHYCIFDREFGLEKYLRTKERQIFNPYSVLPAIKDLTEQDDLLTKIDELSKLYKEKKSSMMSNKKGNPSLQLYNTNFSEEIIKDIQAFDKERREERKKHASNLEKKLSSSSKGAVAKRVQLPVRSNCIRAKIGHGFDTDSSGSEEENLMMIQKYDENLPESFD